MLREVKEVTMKTCLVAAAVFAFGISGTPAPADTSTLEAEIGELIAETVIATELREHAEDRDLPEPAKAKEEFCNRAPDLWNRAIEADIHREPGIRRPLLHFSDEFGCPLPEPGMKI
jgi:hypothetical protein